MGASEEGLVGFDDATQLGRLARCQCSQKAVAPAERGADRDAAPAGGPAHAGRVLTFRVEGQPLFLVSQPGQRCAGQSVERAAARPTAKAVQPVRQAPASHVVAAATGALTQPGCGGVEQVVHRGLRPTRRQQPGQRGTLRPVHRTNLTQTRFGVAGASSALQLTLLTELMKLLSHVIVGLASRVSTRQIVVIISSLERDQYAAV